MDRFLRQCFDVWMKTVVSPCRLAHTDFQKILDAVRLFQPQPRFFLRKQKGQRGSARRVDHVTIRSSYGSKTIQKKKQQHELHPAPNDPPFVLTLSWMQPSTSPVM